MIGSNDFRAEYVANKVTNWVQDIEQLSALAIDEPQLAYSAYTKALCMRWCFLQRTIPDIKEYFAPLEDVIRDTFIPSIIGRKVTDIERRLLALPVRLGGIGIQNPTVTADIEYANSTIITRNLTKLIEDQEMNLDNYDADRIKSEILRLKMEKEESFLAELREVKDRVNDHKLQSTNYYCPCW